MSESSGKNMLGFLKSTFIIMAIILLAFGCTKAEQEISGAWMNVKSPEIMEFKADGTGVFMYPKSQNPPLAFSWNHTATNKYVLNVDFMGTRKNLTATVNGKSIEIESALGKELYQKHISQ